MSSQIHPRAATSGLALAALFLGAAAIGLAPIFVRLSEIGPTATAFWRPILALPILWLWMKLDKHAVNKPQTKADYRALLLAGFFFAGDLAFWHSSIKLTSVANATLLANFAPIFVTLAAWILYKQKVTRLFLFALAIALAGTMAVIGSSFSIDEKHIKGDMLGVITALFYTGYILSIKKLRERFAVSAIMFWSTLATAVMLLPVALVSGEVFWPQTLYGWMILAGLGWISHAGGQSLIAYALAHLPAQFSSVGLLLQPVLATLIAWRLFGENVSALQIFGAALVLAGIIIARKGS
ncbi:MAG: DMT family transporter [Burkholderiales bacterium]